MEIVHRLQWSIGICTCISSGIGIITCRGTGTCTSAGIGAQDVDYCLTTDGSVRFRNKIYVLDKNELKKVILRDFHVKLY